MTIFSSSEYDPRLQGRVATGFRQYMFHVILAVVCTLGTAAFASADSHVEQLKNESAINAAQSVLSEFMTAFNKQDMAGWAKTLNYPHVRFASGEVNVWENSEEFLATPPFRALEKTGWDHSHWISRKVIMSSAAKVHIATVFERFNDANESIGVFESLYIVTRIGGRWGIQSRSSLAP